MIINHSDRIARLSVLIQVLQELDPDGAWQHAPLLLAYLRDHYCLHLSQAEQLEIYLAEQLEHAEANFSYQQIELFEVAKESDRNE